MSIDNKVSYNTIEEKVSKLEQKLLSKVIK